MIYVLTSLDANVQECPCITPYVEQIDEDLNYIEGLLEQRVQKYAEELSLGEEEIQNNYITTHHWHYNTDDGCHIYDVRIDQFYNTYLKYD